MQNMGLYLSLRVDSIHKIRQKTSIITTHNFNSLTNKTAYSLLLKNKTYKVKLKPKLFLFRITIMIYLVCKSGFETLGRNETSL